MINEFYGIIYFYCIIGYLWGFLKSEEKKHYGGKIELIFVKIMEEEATNVIYSYVPATDENEEVSNEVLMNAGKILEELFLEKY